MERNNHNNWLLRIIRDHCRECVVVGNSRKQTLVAMVCWGECVCTTQKSSDRRLPANCLFPLQSDEGRRLPHQSSFLVLLYNDIVLHSVDGKLICLTWGRKLSAPVVYWIPAFTASDFTHAFDRDYFQILKLEYDTVYKVLPKCYHCHQYFGSFY